MQKLPWSKCDSLTRTFHGQPARERYLLPGRACPGPVSWTRGMKEEKPTRWPSCASNFPFPPLFPYPSWYPSSSAPTHTQTSECCPHRLLSPTDGSPRSAAALFLLLRERANEASVRYFYTCTTDCRHTPCKGPPACLTELSVSLSVCLEIGEPALNPVKSSQPAPVAVARPPLHLLHHHRAQAVNSRTCRLGPHLATRHETLLSFFFFSLIKRLNTAATLRHALRIDIIDHKLRRQRPPLELLLPFSLDCGSRLQRRRRAAQTSHIPRLSLTQV
jgi:hypothetical protein